MIVVLVLLTTGVTVAQPSCTDVIAQAEEKYAEGDFESAIALVSDCTTRDLVPRADVLSAYRLLTMAYMHEDNTAAAKLSLVLLLGLDPSYEPDLINDPPPYTSLVSEVKRELGLPSLAERRCDREVAEAEGHYAEAAYDEAVRVLGTCLGKPELLESETIRANRLLALSYLKLGALAPARSTVTALLTAVPDYEADEVQDLPAYVSLVEIVRGQLTGGSASNTPEAADSDS